MNFGIEAIDRLYIMFPKILNPNRFISFLTFDGNGQSVSFANFINNIQCLVS